MPEDGLVHLIRFPKNVPSDTGPRLGVEQLHRLLFQLIQLHPVLPAQAELVVQFQILGAVVEDSGPAGHPRVGPPALGQLHRLLLHAHNMWDPLGPDHGVGTGPQLRKLQPLQVRVGAVQPVHQDIAVHLGEQILLSLPPGQQLPQPGRGHIHQSRQGDGDDLGLILLGEELPLGGEQLLSVLLCSAKGADPRQLGDDLRVVPQVEGEEHVCPHKQPQLGVRVLSPDGPEGIGGIALALPVQLHAGYLRHLRHG